MNYRLIKGFVIIVLLFLSGCDINIDFENRDQLSGLWTLHIMEVKDPETGKWSEWRDGMQGYLLYGEKGYMALHLTTKGYQDTDLVFPNFNDTIPIEALRHLTNSYMYFANYTIDKESGTVEHARISHSNPADWNKIVKRKYTIKGDTLILQPVEEQNASLRLKWIKSSN